MVNLVAFWPSAADRRHWLTPMAFPGCCSGSSFWPVRCASSAESLWLVGLVLGARAPSTLGDSPQPLRRPIASASCVTEGAYGALSASPLPIAADSCSRVCPPFALGQRCCPSWGAAAAFVVVFRQQGAAGGGRAFCASIPATPAYGLTAAIHSHLAVAGLALSLSSPLNQP